MTHDPTLAPAAEPKPSFEHLRAEAPHTMDLLRDLMCALQGMQDDGGSATTAERRAHEILTVLSRHPNLADLPKILNDVYGEVSGALHGIRMSRETIQSYSIERLRDTHAKLSEVSSTTESAALEMLNGLDRTLSMIDQLEQAPAGATAAVAGPSHEMFDALRNEVNQLYGHLQFQDIIAQQLSGVAALLVDVEQRMETVAGIFDRARTGESAERHDVPDPMTYNADASARDVTSRQALIDEAFGCAVRLPADQPAPAA